jgi:prophage regulatory protein
MSKLIRLPVVKERTGKSRTSIYRDIKRGTFPAPVSIGDRAIAWHEAVIEEWIASRAPVAQR